MAGGKAIFIRLIKNQPKLIKGKIMIKPRDPAKLRVLDRSYHKFARQNKHEETRP